MDKIERTCLFSVVVPVYKIEPTLLCDCLESLVAQHCVHAEFIIVDDGSPDRCGQICDDFAKVHPELDIVHTPNHGVSQARNLGIERARGSYVLFVDGDDQLPEGFLNQLCVVKDSLSDITFFNCDANSNLTSNSGVNGTISLPSTFILARSIVSLSEHSLNLGDVVIGSPWGKAINLDFLRCTGCRFPVGVKKAQDRIFMVELLSYEPKCSYLPLLGYKYVQNFGSVSHKYNPAVKEIAVQTCISMKCVIEHHFDGKQKDQMLQALLLFRLAFFYEIVDLDILNHGNPKSERERFSDFKETVSEYEQCFALSEEMPMPSHRIAVTRSLIAKGHIRLAYDALVLYSALKK
jgi:hypothetical protein